MMPAALRRSSVKLSFVLMGVAFVAALTHMFSSTRVVLDAHTSTTPTAEAISRSYSMIKTEAAARSQRSHAGLEVAKSRRVSVSPGTFIHSRDPFAPQLHESFSFATEECRCPQPPDPADLLSSLNILNRQYEAQLPMPVRIARSPEAHASASSVPRKTQLVDLFSEVFVLNLPDRSDRRHYMCTIMQRLGSEALFWPAFSKYNPIVSAYYSDRKFATSDAIKDYMPPGPPPPTGVEQDAQDTSSKGEENSQQTQPVITEIQVPVLSQVEGDSNVTSADAPASNISWGEHPAPRPNKRKMFTRAQAACYVSHREVWHNIVHRQLPRPSLVLEDDVDIELEFPEIVGNAIRSLPDDWAVLFVGHCFEEKFSHQDVRIAHRCELNQSKPHTRHILSTQFFQTLQNRGYRYTYIGSNSAVACYKARYTSPQDKYLCRVYEAIKPACTHSYVLRNATVASIMLEELGHDVLKPIDLGIISLIENKGDQIPMYVMLPPPITQLWRTQKRRVSSSEPKLFSLLSNPEHGRVDGCAWRAD